MHKQVGWILAYVLTIGGVLSIVHWGNQAVNVISENLPLQREHCIIIDAGHGGEDGGATSCRGKLEKEYNLEISTRLESLMHLLGYATRMTRRTDKSIYTEGETIAARKTSDLKERVKLVENTENPILISIHQNQFPESQYRGAQVFYAETEGSNTLAETVQKNLVHHLNSGSSRREKRSKGVFLMDKITCPGILIECGFLSNYQEEAMLSDPDYQKQLCCVIAASLDTFLKEA